MVIRIVSSLCVILNFFSAYSQQQDSASNHLFNLSIEELLNVKVSATNQYEKTVSNAPGIVTVITGEEIKASGARDLMDVLMKVPGIDFAAEYDNVIGIGVRGLNGTEGKVLVLLDEQPLNETNFGSFAFGNHFLLNNIKSIEVIRGPGSAKYGGIAELAVIKINTKSGGEINGFESSINYGVSNNQQISSSFQIATGNQVNEKFQYSISAYNGTANRSNLLTRTLRGKDINFADSSKLKSNNVNFGMKFNELSIRAIYDQFEFANSEKGQGNVLFDGIFLGVRNKFRISNSWNVSPSIQWKTQNPWQFVKFPEWQSFNTRNSRTTASIISNYTPSSKIQIAVGSEFFQDTGKKLEPAEVYSNGKQKVNYHNIVFLTEGNYNTNNLGLTVGARWVNHSGFGDAFVPRLGVSYQFNKPVGIRHVKLLYSRAFKAPTIQNIDINNNIKPERTHATELETSIKLSPKMLININAFDFVIINPIVFQFNGFDNYENFPRTSTYGTEITYRYSSGFGFIAATYSIYKAKDNQVPNFDIQDSSDQLGAFPNHKSSIYGNFKITKHISIYPEILIFGERFTYIANDDLYTGNPELIFTKLESDYLLNFNILFSKLLHQNLDISVRVKDLTNRKYQFINAYQAGIDPIPAPGREFGLNLTIKLNND